MKLLTKVKDVLEAEDLRGRFRRSGVLLALTGLHSHQMEGSVGVWVVLDEQLGDAQGLLQNEDYAVETRLSEEEMVEIEANGNARLEVLLQKANLFFFSGVTLMVFLLMLLAQTG